MWTGKTTLPPVVSLLLQQQLEEHEVLPLRRAIA